MKRGEVEKLRSREVVSNLGGGVPDRGGREEPLHPFTVSTSFYLAIRAGERIPAPWD